MFKVTWFSQQSENAKVLEGSRKELHETEKLKNYFQIASCFFPERFQERFLFFLSGKAVS